MPIASKTLRDNRSTRYLCLWFLRCPQPRLPTEVERWSSPLVDRAPAGASCWDEDEAATAGGGSSGGGRRRPGPGWSSGSGRWQWAVAAQSSTAQWLQRRWHHRLRGSRAAQREAIAGDDGGLPLRSRRRSHQRSSSGSGGQGRDGAAVMGGGGGPPPHSGGNGGGSLLLPLLVSAAAVGSI